MYTVCQILDSNIIAIHQLFSPKLYFILKYPISWNAQVAIFSDTMNIHSDIELMKLQNYFKFFDKFLTVA